MEPTARQDEARRDADQALIRRILSGDEAALAALYDRYGGLVYSVANRILRDTGGAEEILQDTFHQLWRRAAAFNQDRGNLSAWLLVMARNRSIDRLRRRNSPSEELLQNLPAAGPNLETAAAQGEMVARVRKALEALPEPQRRAMELAYFEGLSQSEIAGRTGDPLGTVKTRMRSALASLKKVLGN